MILNEAKYTGTYHLPFPADLIENKTIKISQGFWGNWSHAANQKYDNMRNDLGAIDISTSRNPNVDLYSIWDGKAVLVGSGSTNLTAIESVINGVTYRLEYLHLKSGSSQAAGIKVNDEIKMGQKIGIVGDYGSGGAIHLDFRIKRDGINIDPLRFFDFEKYIVFSEY